MTPFPAGRLNIRFLPVIASFFFLSAVFPAFPFEKPKPGSCYVYPSPATGSAAFVVYQMPQQGSVEVRLYNESGDLVLDVTEPQNAGIQRTGMNLTYLRRGIYLCQVLLKPEMGLTQTLKVFEFSVVR